MPGSASFKIKADGIMHMYWENTDKTQGLSTLGVQEPLSEYLHKMVLCSHFEHLICDLARHWKPAIQSVCFLLKFQEI